MGKKVEEKTLEEKIEKVLDGFLEGLLAYEPVDSLAFKDENYEWATKQLIKIIKEHFKEKALKAVGDGIDVKQALEEGGYSYENAVKNWDAEGGNYLGWLEGRNKLRKGIRKRIRKCFSNGN